MTVENLSNVILRTIGIILGIIGIVWFFIQIKMILIYILISAILSLISRPVMRFLTQKLKFKNVLAVITTLSIYVLLISLFFIAFSPLINKQSENISLLNSNDFKKNITYLMTEVDNYLKSHNIDALEKIKNIDLMPSIKQIPNIVNFILNKIASFGIGLFSVLFITFFFMLDLKILQKNAYAFIPEKYFIKTVRSIERIKNVLSRYFIALVIEVSILFILYTIILISFDIKNAFIISLLCALLNLIPYLGPLMGTVVISVLSATSDLNLDFQKEILPNTIWIMVAYIISQVIDNFIIQPIIFSKSIKSHPLEIFLTLIIFANLFGILGMMISIPTYNAFKIIVKEFFDNYRIVKILTKKI